MNKPYPWDSPLNVVIQQEHQLDALKALTAFLLICFICISVLFGIYFQKYHDLVERREQEFLALPTTLLCFNAGGEVARGDDMGVGCYLTKYYPPED